MYLFILNIFCVVFVLFDLFIFIYFFFFLGLHASYQNTVCIVWFLFMCSFWFILFRLIFWLFVPTYTHTPHKFHPKILSIFYQLKMNTKGDGIVSAEEEGQPSISEHIVFAIGHLIDLICKHSYVFSNVTMMVCDALRLNSFA